MERVSASERTREELRALIDGRLGTAASRSDLVRLAVRLIVEEALDAEATDALGRERYERAEGGAKGYRNGYRRGTVKTAEGAVTYAAPQLRETPEPFVSAIREGLAGRTEALEDLAVELYARGLSTRDIEDTFTGEDGKRLLSRAAVSEVTERLWKEYDAFCTRDLAEHRIAYLFVDGIAERLRAGRPREAVLAAPSRPPGLDPCRDGSRGLLARDGASARTAARSSSTSWRGRRRTPRRCAPSFRTCVPAVSATRCWWSRTARRA